MLGSQEPGTPADNMPEDNIMNQFVQSCKFKISTFSKLISSTLSSFGGRLHFQVCNDFIKFFSQDSSFQTSLELSRDSCFVAWNFRMNAEGGASENTGQQATTDTGDNNEEGGGKVLEWVTLTLTLTLTLGNPLTLTLTLTLRKFLQKHSKIAWRFWIEILKILLVNNVKNVSLSMYRLYARSNGLTGF